MNSRTDQSPTSDSPESETLGGAELFVVGATYAPVKVRKIYRVTGHGDSLMHGGGKLALGREGVGFYPRSISRKGSGVENVYHIGSQLVMIKAVLMPP
jgi:hypothetical protein